MATKRHARDFTAVEQRRKKAARLVSKGMTQAAVARELAVSRQSVSVRAKALDADQQAWRRKPMGYGPGLGMAQRRWLCQLLQRGAEANGFANDAWTLRRIGQVIEREFGISYGKTNVWVLLKAMGFSCQRPTGRARQCNERAIWVWKHHRWPMLKKKARREGRTILFIDETGLSQRPTRVRTWALRGCTPMLQYSFNWKQLTVIAAPGLRGFHFRFVHGRLDRARSNAVDTPSE